MYKNAMFLITSLFLCFSSVSAEKGALDFSSYEWTLINGEAQWSPRAGLQVVNLRNRFYLMGGRTPRPPTLPSIPGDSDIWGDVWVSSDKGASWQKILETDDEQHWPARQFVPKRGA